MAKLLALTLGAAVLVVAATAQSAPDWKNRYTKAHEAAVKYRAQRDRVQDLLTLRVREARKLRILLRTASVQGVLTSPLERAFLCIYSHENAGFGWTANTHNGYQGGLQMDGEFQRSYGPEFLRLFGSANRWPVPVQLAVAIRAWQTRGYHPWPNTARMCGLL